MRTSYANQNDSLLVRAIDNGCAFSVNFVGQQIPAGAQAVFRFETDDLPLFLWSRILKSTGDRAEYRLFTGPTITGTPVEVAMPVVWLNQEVDNGRAPKMTCTRLDGVTLSGGTQLAGDVTGSPELNAKRVLRRETTFYAVFTNTTAGNITSAFELVLIELRDGKYPGIVV